MTTEHPEDAHKYAPEDTVLLDGLHGVERATRRIAASRRQHGGEVPAVGLDQPYGQASHGNRRQPARRSATPANLLKALPNSVCNSANVAPAAAGRADTTLSLIHI